MTGQTADSYEFFIYKEEEAHFSHVTSILSPNGHGLESYRTDLWKNDCTLTSLVQLSLYQSNTSGTASFFDLNPMIQIIGFK